MVGSTLVNLVKNMKAFGGIVVVSVPIAVLMWFCTIWKFLISQYGESSNEYCRAFLGNFAHVTFVIGCKCCLF